VKNSRHNEIKSHEANRRQTVVRQARKSSQAAAGLQWRVSLAGGTQWRITNLRQAAGAMAKWA
jgi:hypothetical protein